MAKLSANSVRARGKGGMLGHAWGAGRSSQPGQFILVRGTNYSRTAPTRERERPSCPFHAEQNTELASTTSETMVKVQLRVYDLSRGLAKQLSLAMLGRQVDGIWHTGVLVHGLEYFYGGGVQPVTPCGTALFLVLGETAACASRLSCCCLRLQAAENSVPFS